jgi:hypothetical protein
MLFLTVSRELGARRVETEERPVCPRFSPTVYFQRYISGLAGGDVGQPPIKAYMRTRANGSIPVDLT